MRLRQIHLDFHTSEAIENIARDFDAEAFADTLAKAHVDSITCFSRCHHGWLYYPSRLFPERIHPHLKEKDLLGEQIRACRARGINVPVYLPLQWDHYSANENPGWLVLDENGRQFGTGPYEAGFYRQLCLNTPYRDLVLKQALEVLEMYPDCDGLFLDIINSRECSCPSCRKGMVEAGIDPTLSEGRRAYMRMVIRDFTEYISAEIRKVNPDASIYYNHSHVRLSHRQIIDGFTHLELESLPGGGWGYWDFPITIRYARTLGVPCIGQTGKFHSSWGDFNSLKTKAALEYETFRSLAFAAGCSIGDQLDPLGDLNESTYKLIGEVYGQVEEKEPWCRGAEAVTEIGVLSPDRFEGTANGGLSPDISGCTRMLQELGYQFDIIDEEEEFSAYKVLVLPDNVAVEEARFGDKLKAYLDGGGAVLSSYRSGRDGGGAFRYFDPGVAAAGPAPFSPDFIVPEGVMGEGLEPTDYVMYEKAECVEPREGTEVLCWVNRPYFNRSWEHFCSHQHSPSSRERAYPGVLRKGNHIHFIHPVFSTFHRSDPYWCKSLVDNALKQLLPDPMVRHNGPSTLTVTVNRLKVKGIYVAHLLHYIPERRGERFDSIHDVIPLHDLELSLSLPGMTGKAVSVPEGLSLETAVEGDRVKIKLPVLKGHGMIELGSRG